MTEYYAVNLQDPNDRVELDSTTLKEAENEMEQMQGYQLRSELSKEKYAHVFDIAFEVESYHTSDDVPIEEIRQALLKRIVSLDDDLLRGNDQWNEAVGLVDSSDIDFEPKNSNSNPNIGYPFEVHQTEKGWHIVHKDFDHSVHFDETTKELMIYKGDEPDSINIYSSQSTEEIR